MRRFYATAILLTALIAAPAIVPTFAGTSASGNIVYLASPPRYFVSSDAGALPPGNVCNVGSFDLHCYTPAVMQKAYNFVGAYRLVGGYANAGAGETIVIIDAYGSPTIRHDLSVFDGAFGIPAANLNIICPQGCPAFNPASANEIGWSFETTLDVEYAHAMAPAATIDLVVASTNYGSAINNAEQYALDNHLGQVWSQSFGAPECAFAGDNSQFVQSQSIYRQAASSGVTLIASAGDTGAQEGCPSPSALYPSSSPYSLAVGGTHLNVGANGAYKSETTWNDLEDGYLLNQGVTLPLATGGAPSVFFSLPSWQTGLYATPYACQSGPCSAGSPAPLGMRTTSDVSYNADLDGGVIGYWSAVASYAGFYIFGGTSAGSPQWAAVIAIADQLSGSPLGYVNQQLYALAGTNGFHDVTVGSNTLAPGTGYLATPGYDPPTGLGSPNVGVLVQELS
ncbi:MAG: S53 family peptidase [Nitrososphaerota archaeon]|nr:S53 family peptidase [Nitrososphaerota archaeon]MDG6939964.1 S53 family peptidase [Nitrososphaerota archaeon]